jgi:hypothetical protein
MPANFDVLLWIATSLRPPAGGVVRCRAQAPSATQSHRCAAHAQHREHDFADPLAAEPAVGGGYAWALSLAVAEVTAALSYRDWAAVMFPMLRFVQSTRW